MSTPQIGDIVRDVGDGEIYYIKNWQKAIHDYPMLYMVVQACVGDYQQRWLTVDSFVVVWCSHG